MRIRKRFPSYPIVPSSVASSFPCRKEEMEVSSFPKTSAERAHKLLSSSSYTYSKRNRTVLLGVQEEHSSTGPDFRSRNEGNKSLLDHQENPIETMVIEQGGGENARKLTLDHNFLNSQKRGKYSRSGRLNRRATTVLSSSYQGIVVGDIEDRKAEAPLRFLVTKPRTRRVWVNGPVLFSSEDSDTMERTHTLLSSSSYTSTKRNRTVLLGVQEEHSSTVPGRNNGEPVAEFPSRNGRDKSLLDQENPTQTMVIEQGGGNVRKRTSDHFPDSQKKGKYFRTGRLNRRATTVPTSSYQGIVAGYSEDRKTETPLKFLITKPRTVAREDRKAETPILKFLITKPRTRRVWINGGSLRESKDKTEYEYEKKKKKKVKTRTLRSIYADIRSIMRIYWPSRKRKY